MLIVISPAKKLDFATPAPFQNHTQPVFLAHSQALINAMKQRSELDLMDLMKLSAPLAQLNFERYRQWRAPFDLDNAKQALLAFQGDVYRGLQAEDFSLDDFAFAQQHLRILSGLYGVLKPLDLMQPYRLEMGTKLATEQGKNLYDFWGETITQHLNQTLAEQGDDVLINLASNEYFKSVKPKSLQGTIITPAFKENKGGQYKMIGVYAKKARGLLSRYIIKNRLQHVHDLQSFALDGYVFNPALSAADTWTFTRG